MTVCNGKTRGGTLCQRPAGWGTDHVGEGRCKLHGGMAGRPPTHGRYSVTRRAGLREKYEHFFSDPAAGDLRDELALLRAMLQAYLDGFDEYGPVEVLDVGKVMEMVDAIGKMVERIAKILAATALTQAELQLLQVTLIDAIQDFIPEPERQRAFVSRIAGALGQRVGANLGTLSIANTDTVTPD